MTAADPGRLLLDKIDAREQALTREAGQVQTLIDELTAKLRELSEAISHLQITRKTLISLAGEDDDGPPQSQPSRLPRSPITPPTSRSSPPSPTSAVRSGPATCAWPWTCRSCPRTPRTSAPS